MMQGDDGGDYDSVPQQEDADLGAEASTLKTTVVEPLEIDSGGAVRGHTDEVGDDFGFRWILSSVGVTLVLIVPVLVTYIILIQELIGRIWPATLFAVHLTVALWTASALVISENAAARQSICRRLIPSILDILLFGFLYVGVCNILIENFFTDVDGTLVVEYESQRSRLVYVRVVGRGVAFLRFVIAAMALSVICARRRYRTLGDVSQLPRSCATALAWLEQRFPSLSPASKRRLLTWLRRILRVLLFASVIVLIWCLTSIALHWISWSAPKQHGPLCDPLDTTECSLPFPSFHHMIQDSTTDSGWRVNLKRDALPPLKGGITLDPSFLNQLDGFSTMAPLLFYMNGLKEAHESGSSDIRLQGAENIELSVTNRSITLLLDVDAQALIPHTAEIDYLDSKRPLVLVFPASPLRHNSHYALAVVHATDVDGNRLPPTPGMRSLFSGQEDVRHMDRRDRYESTVIPTLVSVAPWISYDKDPDSLQLLFDFQTISAKSQLGPIRAVRDAVLAYIEGPEWGDWSEHARVIKTEDGICSRAGTLIARTIHAEMDVPWFLEGFGPGHREAILDSNAMATGQPVTMGKAKFVVHVPCSVRAAAIDGASAAGLRAIMEYGHGLFFNRNEATDRFLLEMANENGYIITAMDWRGMSSYDLLVVIKVLMSKPSLFQAVRDNLIQGYANKLAMQHFMKNGMLDSPWLQFHAGSNRDHPLPLFEGMQPASIFYGISQGGILGAGYSALSGITKLIDRTILGVPGTPFALILTRSLDFTGYDAILLLNFFNNRHVRILLSLVQMAWDPAEGSGVLAPPITEPIPKTLLQAGLGDAVVPTIACEALARAMGASTLPNSPREIYGLKTADSTIVSSNGPSAVLTELRYVEESASLPMDDIKASNNAVHICVRRDPHLIEQITEFINTGQIVDPCEEDGCVRARVTCGKPY